MNFPCQVLNHKARRGLIARMKWYRVVLDEAQFIRNRFATKR